MLIFIAIGVGLGIVAYQAGLFDRPEYKYYESLIVGDDDDKDKNDRQCLYTLLAFSNEKQIGKHIERLLFGVLKGIKEAIPNNNHEKHLLEAVTLYNKGKPVTSTTTTTPSTTMISVGLYFDDPNDTDKPRWGAGISVGNDSLTYDEWIKLLPTIQEKSGLIEPIRLVRVGGKCTSILKANIPYHNMLTPMLAPMIQWTRAYKAFAAGKYTANNGRSNNDTHGGGPALELYHCSGGTNGKCFQMHKLEYIVLMDDVSQTWNDALPITVTSTKEN
jgi:hypothetical protein